MNFDFSATAGAKEGGKRIASGIKNCTFKGIDYSTVTSQKTGETFKTMVLKLNIDGYGDYSQNFFEPTSAERTEGQYGMQPSQLDHFMISVREILEAFNTEELPLLKDTADKKTVIWDGEDSDDPEYVAFTGQFKKIVSLVKAATDKFIDSEIEVKFIPQNNGYCSIPGFPARITKNGDVGISTRFIGHNLVLSASELKKIDAEKTAAPTNMASKVNAADLLGKMAKEEDGDDLPF